MARLGEEAGVPAGVVNVLTTSRPAEVTNAMVAKMRNAGEACTAANRFYVQSGIHDAFVAGLTTRMAALKIGPGYEPSTQCGPMITQNAVRKIDRLVSDAVAGGARATTGGKPLYENGYFYPPTVLENVPVDAAIAREEIFGPVAPVYKFDSEEEVIRLANDTEYGLAAYIYSGDLKRAMGLATARCTQCAIDSRRLQGRIRISVFLSSTTSLCPST